MKKQIWKKLVIFTLAVAVVMAFALSNQNARLFASEGEEVAAQEPAPAPAPAPAPEPAPAPAPEPAPAPAEEPAPAPAGEPKAEEPKAEEPKTEEPKSEEAPAEEPKTEQPTEEKTEEKKEEQQAEEAVLPAAQLPITVKLVDAQGTPVGEGTWTGTVAFAEGQVSADVTLPAVEGYVAPALKVERNKETTALNVTAIYAAAKAEQKASFTATFAIAGIENGKVTAAGAEATNGYSLKLTEGETLSFTAAPNEGCTVTVKINGAEVAIATGNTYSIPMDGDKTVAITFAKPQTEEAKTEEAKTEEAEAEKPNRSIHLSLAGNPSTLKYGDSVTLVATLTGFENVEYTVAWQYSTDGSSWQDCGITGETMTVVVSPENANNYWNVLVTITGEK